MGTKKFLIGLVFLVALALGTTGVAACNGGGGDVFSGNMFFQNYWLTDGAQIEPFAGLANIDVPYLDPALTTGMDTVVIRNAYVNVMQITPEIEATTYLDYASADVLVISGVEPPVCDEMFGYMRYIDEANIIACTYPTNCLVSAVSTTD